MRFIILSILVYSFLPGRAQDTTELNRRNGFKSIKLGSPIDSVKGAIFKRDFKEKDEFPARQYEVVNEEYNSLGEVKVKEIQVMTYKNLIYKIIVFTEKDPRLMRALEKSYGKSAFVVRTASYNWVAEKLSLTFRAQKNSLELTYRSYPLLKRMRLDKGKKVDEIAEDL